MVANMQKFFGITLMISAGMAFILLLGDSFKNKDPYRYFSSSAIRTQKLEIPPNFRSKEINSEKVYSQRLNAKEILITDNFGRTRIRLGVNEKSEPSIAVFNDKGVKTRELPLN
jgi:hypothetical protein